MSNASPFAPHEIQGVPRWESIRGALRFIANPLPVIDNAIETYGPTYYTRTIGDQRILMTIDPDVVQHILQKNNKNYQKSHLQVNALGKYVGLGLLTANGEYWRQQRRLIQPSFYKAKIEALTTIMHSEICRYGDELHNRLASDETLINVSEEMMRLALRIVSKALFGTGISDEKIEEIHEKFTALQKHIVLEVRQPIFNWYRNLSGKSKRAMKTAGEIRDILQEIINNRRQANERRDDLLDMLLHSRYEDTGETMTDQQIMDEALILFTAGHETSANSLTWGLYLLSQHKEHIPEMISEYQHAVSEQLNTSSLILAEKTYNVINEVMRLYPPAWILDRIALDDDEVKGIKINKGDLMGLYVYGLHRHPALWQENDQFHPNRFNEESNKDRHRYQFIPFGGGPRLCIGHRFAMVEMQLAIGHLLTHFDWTYPDKKAPPSLPLITLRPKTDIYMNVSVR